MDQGAAIRWDILEEHLDEAAFLRDVWEEALRSPLYTPAEIADGPEARLLAHVDGLALALPSAAERLLLPALAGEEAGQAFAAAFALAEGGGPRDLAATLAALEKAAPATRDAIVRALAVASRADLGQRIAGELPRAPAAIRPQLAWILAYRRIDPGLRLEPFAASADAADRTAALRAARAYPALLDPRAIDQAMADEIPGVRAAALETCAVVAPRAALAACRTELDAGGPAFGTAALLLALSGDEQAVEPLVAALRDPDRAAAAAFALGFTGRVGAADALVDAMADEGLAPVAAEAFCAISGLTLGGPLLAEPPPEEPLGGDDEEAPYGPESDLPVPAPAAVAGWWKEARASLDPAQRWMRGQAWSHERILAELEGGPARRREALALDLAIRTGGEVQVAWDALASRQGAELAAARAVRVRGGTYGEAPAARTVRTLQPAAPLPRRRPRRPPPADALAVTAVGLATSLGASAPHACAAARAGLARPAPLEAWTFDPEDGETAPVIGHAVAGLAGFDGLGRFASLAALALSDLVRRAGAELSGRTGLFLAVPSGWYASAADRLRAKGLPPDDEPEEAPEPEEPPSNDASDPLPGPWQRLAPRLAKELVPRALALASLPRPAVVRLFPLDSPGFVAALEAARAALSTGEVDRCVVGGVDTLVTSDDVESLDVLGLLKSAESPTGLAPGEAAAFVLVERADAARRRGAAALCQLGPWAAASEPGDSLESPAQGRALAQAIREALPPSGEGAPWPRLVIADHNGTSHRAQDWGTAQVHLRLAGPPAAAEVYPALSFGEIGAATGAAAVALAASAFARGWAGDDWALAWLSADAGGRAAFVLTAPAGD